MKAVTYFAFLVAVAVICGCEASTAGDTQESGPVRAVSADDAEMNAAIERARATLPAFWSARAHPASDETGFALKIRVTDGAQVEHFWCQPIVGDQASASCTIDDNPSLVRNVHAGSIIQIDTNDISDWMYMKGDKIKGAETLRALLPQMSKKEAEQYRAMLE